MARGTGGPLDPDTLIEGYRLYDRAVDVVSIYHWLFTDTRELPSTVAHFERYPRIKTADGTIVTPDFTVLFNDGRGIAGEIANIALHDNSIESLCRQLERYSRLTQLPDAQGGLSKADPIDVLFLTPIDNASAAVRRVFTERLDNPVHWFKPARRPVVVQFAATPDVYVMQFWPDKTVNGELSHSSEPNYGTFEELKVRPGWFGSNKVEYGFMNDPVMPLYLATRLWTSVFPSRFGTEGFFEATANEISEVVREQYGFVRKSDVDAAMGTLRAAGLAVEIDGKWRVKRRNLRSVADDVHSAIARLVDRPPPVRRRSGPGSGDQTLFELDGATGEIVPVASRQRR